MRLSFLTVVLAGMILVGCATKTQPKLQIQQPTTAVVLPQNPTLNILRMSAQFDTFDTVRTNSQARQSFTNLISVLNKHLDTQDCNTTLLKNDLESSDSIVSFKLAPCFNLLLYYTQYQTNCASGLQAVKTGVEQGLGQ